MGEDYEEDDYDYDLNEILNETEPPTTSSTTTPAPTTRFSSRTKATTQRIPKLLGGTFQGMYTIIYLYIASDNL